MSSEVIGLGRFRFGFVARFFVFFIVRFFFGRKSWLFKYKWLGLELIVIKFSCWSSKYVLNFDFFSTLVFLYY